MEQQRLADYLNLIKQLLSCPQGEEWIHLKRQESLVDAQFVQVMEQVAAQLAQQGNQKSAMYLHNWAAKLHHILIKERPSPAVEADKSEAYLELIQKLLDCPEGMEDAILKAHETLIGPGLINQMNTVVRQLSDIGETDTATYLSNLAAQIKHDWLRVHRFPAEFVKEESSTAEEDLDPWKMPPVKEDLSAFVSIAQVHQQAQQQAIIDGLNAATEMMRLLNETIKNMPLQNAQSEKAANPLWHLYALEKACSAQWQLTTEEVEQLIGVKPHCRSSESSFMRGNWQFVKVGKLGGQSAWQVHKR